MQGLKVENTVFTVLPGRRLFLRIGIGYDILNLWKKERRSRMKKIFVLFVVSALFMIWGNYSADVSAEGLQLKEMAGGNIRYVAGGIGENERTAMKKKARDFHLKLVFAKVNGNYLSQIPFQIFSSNGEKILDAVADGPWVLVDLPPGTYAVSAHHDGKKRSHTVQLGSGFEVRMFHWR
jgi:hypothetical protein